MPIINATVVLLVAVLGFIYLLKQTPAVAAVVAADVSKTEGRRETRVPINKRHSYFPSAVKPSAPPARYSFVLSVVVAYRTIL